MTVETMDRSNSNHDFGGSTNHGVKRNAGTTLSILHRLLVPVFALAAMLFGFQGTVLSAPPDNAPIWRAQILLRIADIEDAGTDDDVRVQLNAANGTWLDYGRDDFERDDTFTYDLNLDGLRKISDLDYIRISKNGSDGLALKSFALLINGRTIYVQAFSGGGHWLDSGAGYSRTYTVSHHTLTHSASWGNYTQPFPPLSMTRGEIESRIEGRVGDFIAANPLFWGDEVFGRGYVEVKKKPNTEDTLSVDLDLTANIPYAFDPEVDVDFDITVRCADRKIALGVDNVKVYVDSDWYQEVLTLGLVQAAESFLNSGLKAALKDVGLSMDFDVPFCPVIKIDNDGNVNFSLAARPAPAPRVTDGRLNANDLPAAIVRIAQSTSAPGPVIKPAPPKANWKCVWRWVRVKKNGSWTSEKRKYCGYVTSTAA